jgi:F-type H+-transporting ATPase subunit delta
MARVKTSARRYAEAAFQIAERDGTVDEWLGWLDRIGAVIADERTARALADPAVPFEVRRDALFSGLGTTLPRQIHNLVLLLLRRHRIEAAGEIAREFRRLYQRRLGITTGTITSAAPLTQEESIALARRLEEMTTGRVEITFLVDPAILGGVVVRLGDRLIDGSVRGRLERLRTQLASAAF